MSTNKPSPDFTADPYWGQGGRYIVGPDGKRVPAPPEPEPASISLPFPGEGRGGDVQESSEPSPQPTLKGKRHV